MSSEMQPPSMPARMAGSRRAATLQLGWVALCGLGWIWVVSRLASEPGAPGSWTGAEALLLGLTSFSVLASAACQLPLQNVLMSALLVSGLGAAAQVVSSWMGTPLLPVRLESHSGGNGLAPWWLPSVWILSGLGSRSYGRLVLRPWRRAWHYGYILLAVESILSLLVFCGLWMRAGEAGFGLFVNALIAWVPVNAGIQVAALPFLIDKAPVCRPLEFAGPFAWFVWNSAWVVLSLAREVRFEAVCYGAGLIVALVFGVRGLLRAGN